MDIHFVSSANPDDEDRFAPVLLQALRPLLDRLPIAYTLRIQTATGRVLQHSRTEVPDAAPVETRRDSLEFALEARPTIE